MLRAESAAFHSGDPNVYKEALYELRKSIKTAISLGREKVESCYSGSNTRHMWSGLRTITDYKGKGCSMGEVPASHALRTTLSWSFC